MLVPGEAQLDDDVLLATAAAAGLLGALLLIAHDRLPLAGFHVVALLGTALATAAVYGWGTDSALRPAAVRLGHALRLLLLQPRARRSSTSR